MDIFYVFGAIILAIIVASFVLDAIFLYQLASSRREARKARDEVA